MDLNWQNSLIILGLAIIALLIFTFMWGRFAPPSSAIDGNNHYTPIIYLKTEDIPPIITTDIPESIPEPVPNIIPEEATDIPVPIKKREIIKPIIPVKYKPKYKLRTKIIDEIVPLYSKKRRSRGENMCAKSLEELFGVPFPTDRPNWAMGKKGRPLEYDCINHDLKLALEYNGQQHYEAGHFNMDEDGFADQNERDRMKFEYATENGYYLITVPHTVPIEEIKDYIIRYLPGNRKKRLDQDLTL